MSFNHRFFSLVIHNKMMLTWDINLHRHLKNNADKFEWFMEIKSIKSNCICNHSKKIITEIHLFINPNRSSCPSPTPASSTGPHSATGTVITQAQLPLFLRNKRLQCFDTLELTLINATNNNDLIIRK